MTIEIYYHIFGSDQPQCFDIIVEQVEYILKSEVYDKIEQINCCITGNNQSTFKKIIEYIQTLPKKFVILKSDFADTTFERYTLKELAKNVKSDSLYLYIHSKGSSTTNKAQLKPISHWRNCMMYFLVTHGLKCLERLQTYDTVGIFQHPTHSIPHYSGNFWWATGAYLKRLFSENEISDDYLGPEMFLFLSKPNAYNLYPMPTNYNGYIYSYPYELYRDYVIQ